MILLLFDSYLHLPVFVTLQLIPSLKWIIRDKSLVLITPVSWDRYPIFTNNILHMRWGTVAS